jgi:hypothetical protein
MIHTYATVVTDSRDSRDSRDVFPSLIRNMNKKITTVAATTKETCNDHYNDRLECESRIPQLMCDIVADIPSLCDMGLKIRRCNRSSCPLNKTCFHYVYNFNILAATNPTMKYMIVGWFAMRAPTQIIHSNDDKDADAAMTQLLSVRGERLHEIETKMREMKLEVLECRHKLATKSAETYQLFIKNSTLSAELAKSQDALKTAAANHTEYVKHTDTIQALQRHEFLYLLSEIEEHELKLKRWREYVRNGQRLFATATATREICCICLHNKTDCILPCFHMNCRECVTSLTTDNSKHPECPQCRGMFKPKDTYTIIF